MAGKARVQRSTLGSPQAGKRLTVPFASGWWCSSPNEAKIGAGCHVKAGCAAAAFRIATSASLIGPAARIGFISVLGVESTIAFAVVVGKALGYASMFGPGSLLAFPTSGSFSDESIAVY